MTFDPLGVAYTAVFLAAVAGVYGVAVAVVWSPFLLSGRLRALFEALPPGDSPLGYLWLPLPAAVWGFLFGAGLSASRDLLSPGDAAPLYAAGVDGIVVATLVSAVLWPAAVLWWLPRRGVVWRPDGDGPETVALVVAGVVWYLLWLAGPAYVLSVFAGFGQAMSGG